ncbi:hypothetical protein KQH62_03165 [bacterium]|nr:hypothetical protein [bacterium]
MDKKHLLYRKMIPLMGLLISGALILTACGFTDVPKTSDLASTYAAQTLQAVRQAETLSAYETLAAQLTRMAQVTATPTPTQTATVTSIPPTATLTPTATATQLRCNWVDFVKDVTISDGEYINPNGAFTKTWRLKNIGSCTWTRDYDLVFVGGQTLGAPTRVGLPESVAPGETVDLSVLMKAPSAGGTYVGYWMLADANGNRFGIHSDASDSFWVRIKVDVKDDMVYNFVEEACDADWNSYTANNLPCSGSISDNDTGFVIVDEYPTREGGGAENEAGLITSPDYKDEEGRIVGVFPAFKVKDGDVFKAVIGCAHNQEDCDLIFELRYQIGNGTKHTLKSWREVYEGKMNSVTVDLSDLAGLTVNFNLRVRNNHTAEDNVGLWILPRIMR